MSDKTETELSAAAKYFLAEFDAYWRSEHVRHPNAEAFAYLRTARNRVAKFFPATEGPKYDGRSGYEIAMARINGKPTQ